MRDSQNSVSLDQGLGFRRLVTSMSTVSTVRSRKRAHDSSGQKVNVINLETTAPVVDTGNQHQALILMGTRTSPIDVEALDDKRGRKIVRCSVPVVDLEKNTSQRVYGVAGARVSQGGNCQGAPPVICLSPDREEGTIFQPKNVAQISRTCAKVAPKEPIFTCPVCLNKLEQPSTTKCGHIFCESCIKQSIKAQKKCPTCRTSLGVKSFHRVYLPTSAD